MTTQTPAIIVSHIDAPAAAPATHPAAWTPEIIAAVEAGRISVRQANRQAARA